MTPANWIALAAILATVALAAWKAVRAQAKSDAKAQWAKITELERKVQHLETIVFVLKKGMEAMPTSVELHVRLQELAERIENRLTVQSKEIHEALLEIIKRSPVGAR